jgi:tripartite-type tricarboxylate transporter receptor subunit TctC
MHEFPMTRFKDFAPVTLAAISPNVLVVHPSVPAADVTELISLVKQNPGKFSFAHPGKGTTAQLSGEMFRRSQNLDMAPVPFNGSAPAIQSTVGNHTPIAFTVITPAVPQGQGGRLRALAVTTPMRSQALPAVPTLAEAGLPGQEAFPPGDSRTRRHASSDHRAAASGDQRGDYALNAEGRLAGLGFDPIANTPQEYGARIQAEIKKWGKRHPRS